MNTGPIDVMPHFWGPADYYPHPDPLVLLKAKFIAATNVTTLCGKIH